MKKTNFVDHCSKLWLIGTLLKIDRPTYASAFYEFLYLFLWSILPFALGSLVLYVTDNALNKDLFQLSLKTFSNGELLVFTISMLAPILYSTLHDPDGATRFPHKLPISTVVTLVMVTCAALFALLKASAVKDVPFVFNLSIWLTALALAFRYLSLIYHKYRLPPTTELKMREGQVEFVNEYRNHIEKENPSRSPQAFATELAAHIGAKK
jgi:hypothetical protein